MTPTTSIGHNGWLVLHGNRLEDLAETVFAWTARHPLGPLEEEAVLVQSNGMAEWVKMALATRQGVCAATRVELPARFLWRAYRAVLGRSAVPPVSAVDKQPLVWRLMALLPGLVHRDPALVPLVAALGDGNAERRLALAQRLADLLDQYQVYRADWLDDWAAGRDQLRPAAGGTPLPLPDTQAWQPVLWRAILQHLTPAERSGARPVLQSRALQALQNGRPDAAAWPGLPRRLIVFGSTQLPPPMLDLLAALEPHVQLILAVPNPCRYFWADLIDGRERLRFARRRHPLRGGQELSALPLEAMHAHGHPLLASWGRQARDFIRQLDALDDVQRSRQRFDVPRVDLFDDGPGESLLQQVQARIRDGVPLAEHNGTRPVPTDRSIVFHTAHSAQREVEILHDQLLQLLADPPGGTPLSPRDIVVMVPDVETFAPAIRAVFGQHPRGHARHIPWGIADVRERGRLPLLQTLEWLLRAPEQRFTLGEWRDALELPAMARRFGLGEDDVPTAVNWLQDAGVRWGLHADQRRALGLQAAGEVGSWVFGLRRLLLGYAAGALDDGFGDIEPYTEVAGLEAGVAGGLAEMAHRLQGWWADAQQPRSPAAWALRLRALLADVFEAQGDADCTALAALEDALSAWLQACDAADFDEAVPLSVLREAWLGALPEPGGGQRFKAGGVTFCTLLPMRAIPFEVVCLLGMNEGDYPRAAAPADLDLMALPGMGRPGDRSRRDDDRQLMLDALLSARRVLHISWVGRSQRDNTDQPPSVLVAQLRDYLDAGWGDGVCAERTLAHPLQPFSRRYFEPAPQAQGETAPLNSRLFTYASEWYQAHEAAAEAILPVATALPDDALPWTFNLSDLSNWLRNPVKAFFRHRLKVVFDEDTAADVSEDESFDDSRLERAQWVGVLLQGLERQPLDVALRRLAREGRLPLAGPGAMTAQALADTVQPMRAEGERVRRMHPRRADPLPVDLSSTDGRAVLQGTLQDLWSDEDGEDAVWLQWASSSLRGGQRTAEPRADKLLGLWLQSLACSAAGCPAPAILIGTDSVAALSPADPSQARALLIDLLGWVAQTLDSGRAPATAARTGLAWLKAQQKSDDATKIRRAAVDAYEGSEGQGGGEGREACLQRVYPRFDDLARTPHFEDDTRTLYSAFLADLAQRLQLDDLPQAADAPEEDGDD